MKEQLEDWTLLMDFARHKDEEAFATVVRHHLGLVYATALRKVEDQGAAQEIAQNVFAALARKAWQFAPDDSLPSWLHRSTLLESKEWWRGELRRRKREQTAVELGTTMKTPDQDPALRALLPLLDEGLLSLREKDRAALLLRFYESQSMREVGAAMGVREEAAQKRVAQALGKLVQFFQRRGFRTATSVSAAAALRHTTVSAPASLASAVLQSALQAGGNGLVGTASLLAPLMSLTRLQTTCACLMIVAVPLVWQGKGSRAAHQAVSAIQSQLQTNKLAEPESSTEIARLQAESAQLDAALIDAANKRAQYEEGLRKLGVLKTRLQDLLAAADSRWPDDLPYVRIAKRLIKDLELQAMFSQAGVVSEAARELLGMTQEEELQSASALSAYWRGVENLMSAKAYETNVPDAKPGRLAKTVIVPPLGEELKTFAAKTREELIKALGEEREKKLFGGWDEGGIQLFWPGNLWKISEQPQTLTVWVEPESETGKPRYGASRLSTLGGTSSEGAWSLMELPNEIRGRFFDPWLLQFGITN